jgi:hypothetical protein
MTPRPRTIGFRWLLLPGVILGAAAAIAVGPPAAGEAPIQPGMRFEREHIRLWVQPAGVRVDGTYHFRNEFSTARVVPLLYPFPVDASHPWPTRIVVSSATGDTLPFSRPCSDAILLRVEMPAGGVGSIRVVYDQPSLDGTACYILTTTRVWERPLDRADFEIHIPSGIELESIAYDVDEMVERPTERVYLFRREGFMPTQDLCVSWVVR